MKKDIAISVGAVPYIIENGKIKYLVLFRRRSRIWEFPQGHMKEEEKELDTLHREVEEETGFTRFDILEGFRQDYDTIDTHNKPKQVIMHIIEFVDDDIVLSEEHSNYSIVSYENAKEMLIHTWRKDLLEKAHEFLTTKLNKAK